MSDSWHTEDEFNPDQNAESDNFKSDPELEELKARFFSIAAHELKTPLTGLLSSLNLIDRYIESDAANWARFKHHEKVNGHLKKARESAMNLSATLNRFLSIQSIENEEIPLKIYKLNLREMLGKQVSQFQTLARDGQQITFNHESGEEEAATDKYLLKNIMINLLTNAIKFSPPGSQIRLCSSIDSQKIKIELMDQGIGIPEAEQKKVFQQYYRAGNTTISEEGTGLGLYIVKHHIDRLGGSIKLKSVLNKGTQIFINLPNHLKHEEDPGH